MEYLLLCLGHIEVMKDGEISSNGRELGWLYSYSSPRHSLQGRTNSPSSGHKIKRPSVSHSINQSFGVRGTASSFNSNIPFKVICWAISLRGILKSCWRRLLKQGIFWCLWVFGRGLRAREATHGSADDTEDGRTVTLSHPAQPPK